MAQLQGARSGPHEDGEVQICLDACDGAFGGEPRLFLAWPGRQREMLAVALAALTTGLHANAELDSVETNTRIKRLHAVAG